MADLLEAFQSGGFMMWPILAAAVTVLALSVRAMLRRGESAGGVPRPADLGGILFWGGFAAALGVLATVVGIAQVMRAIEAAGSAPASLVQDGVRIALVTTVFGLATFGSALLIWFALRWVDRRSAAG